VIGAENQMRELFDEAAGRSPLDPQELVRQAARVPLRKRFYKEVGVAEAEGGFAITLAECCIGTGFGAQIDVPAVTPVGANAFADITTLFSESASRVVVSVEPGNEAALRQLAERYDVPVRRIGVVRGARIHVSIDGRSVIDEALAEVERIWNTAIEQYFEAARAIA